MDLERESLEEFWARPDLALSRDTSRRAGNGLEVTVHNLGGSTTGPTIVRVTNENGDEVMRRNVPALDPPTDLEPRRTTLVLPVAASWQRLVVEVDPDGRIPELNEDNNRLVLQLPD